MQYPDLQLLQINFGRNSDMFFNVFRIGWCTGFHITGSNVESCGIIHALGYIDEPNKCQLYICCLCRTEQNWWIWSSAYVQKMDASWVLKGGWHAEIIYLKLDASLVVTELMLIMFKVFMVKSYRKYSQVRAVWRSIAWVQYRALGCEKGDAVSIIEDWAVVSAGRDKGPRSGVARSSGSIDSNRLFLPPELLYFL